ncbi:hypothetical protein V5O48_003021 [Marasmius crinis-equi]|uniref:Uncharacterized protein n=1 Tax=Marasmius crinis-equi TaxID=585013 RepID=A0ABR3FU23_9AGAR
MAAASKKHPDVAIHRAFGDVQTWVMPLHGQGIIDPWSPSYVSCPPFMRELKGNSFSLASQAHAVFSIHFRVLLHCRWNAEYTAAIPCEGLSNHRTERKDGPCDVCCFDDRDEQDFPSQVHDTVRENNPSVDGSDEVLRLEVVKAFSKVPYIEGLHGTNEYPDGNTVLTVIWRLRTAFAMLRYKPKLVTDFPVELERDQWPLKPTIRVLVPNCYPDPTEMIIHMTDNSVDQSSACGCKLLVLYKAHHLRTQGADFSTLTVSEHVGPTYYERSQDELAVEETVVRLADDAFRRMNADFPPVPNASRPRGQGQRLLTTTLVNLFCTLDVAPTSSNVIFNPTRIYNSNRVRMDVLVHLPEQWPRIRDSAVRFRINDALTGRLADHYVTLSILKEGFVFL